MIFGSIAKSGGKMTIGRDWTITYYIGAFGGEGIYNLLDDKVIYTIDGTDVSDDGNSFLYHKEINGEDYLAFKYADFEIIWEKE